MSRSKRRSKTIGYSASPNDAMSTTAVVHMPTKYEMRRPLDFAHDNIEEPGRSTNYADTYPLDDTTVLYYWRATYWRRLAS